MAADTNPTHERESFMVEVHHDEPEPRPSWKKMVGLALIALALFSIVYFSPLHVYLSHWREVSDQIRSFGALGPLVLTLGVALLVGIGFPRLVFCVIAGMAFGFWSGLLWAQLGTLIGNYAVFVVVRAKGRDWAQRFISRRARLQGIVQHQGVLGVVLARQVPLPGMLINLACAFLPITHSNFLLGTLIGQLPQAIPCTLIGAGVLQQSFAKSVSLIGLAVAVAILAWLGLRLALRRITDKKSEKDQ
jgi:uncharacterized membrane protein YdjX (TVP38/TMEM64 family)